MERKEPVLSICFAARNDSYTSDFEYRITTTLEFLAEESKIAGISDCFEVVIADWGSEVPLHESLSLSKGAARLAKFIYIPREKVLEMQDGKDFFSTSRAFNTAIRHASGTYRLYCGADFLMPSNSLRALIEFLRDSGGINKSLLFIGRKKLPWSIVETQPDITAWKRFLDKNAWMLEKEKALAAGFLWGGSGAIIMHKDLWSESRGACETMTGWGWSDIDLTIRITSRYPWMELSSRGIEMYDMEHNSSDVRSKITKTPNTWTVHDELKLNGEDWGLGNLSLPVSSVKPAKSRKIFKANCDKPDMKSWTKHVSSAISRSLQDAIWSAGPTEDDAELETALALLSAVKYTDCLYLVDVGAVNAYPALSILSHMPWMEYLAIGSWKGNCDPLGPHNLLNMLYSDCIGYKGKGSCIVSPSAVAEYLQNAGADTIDCAIIRKGHDDAVMPLLKKLSERAIAVFVDFETDSVKDYAARLGLENLQISTHIQLCLKGINQALPEKLLLKISETAEKIRAVLPDHGFLSTWKKIGKKAGRCAIFPCGKYVRKLAGFINLAGGAEITAWVDEKSTLPVTENFLPVRPEKVTKDDFDAVILMTDTFGKELEKRCRELWGEQCTVIDYHKEFMKSRKRR